MLRIGCSAVLFDLDGVLVDSTQYVEHQWREWAKWRGLDPAPFLRVCHGRRALETIRLAAPELDAEAEVARFREVPVAEEPVLHAVPGAAELLAALPAGAWAVVTSGSRPMATRRLTSAGLPVPGVLVTAEDVRHGKPSPEGYLRAAERLGVPPADCVVIEDAPPGIEAALAAGMTAVGLTTTHSPAELAAAHHRIASLAELRFILPSAAPRT
ncbi:MAG TPA: HAD-IA family hydrolase [Gemmatimonadales bacterium]|jgi:sugar-phosphatase|nr:HAD-IA family hydrolase [Gemmatimonadales bacterium]